jgi:NAD(P)-dependent dehydrogenase (short-subunit alcohol dehydrogenase family)
VTQVVAATTPLHADLAGRWATVTGASKGIGAAIAEAFVESGGNVVLMARGREQLQSSAEQVQEHAAEGQQGHDVRDVCPTRTAEQSRKRRQGKTDALESLRIAREVQADPDLPVVFKRAPGEAGPDETRELLNL